jgi:hydrogenase maturation protease
MHKIVIAGLGNPYRGDDSVGWLVIDALDMKLPPSIQRVKLRGNITDLLDIFESFPSVYVVDACEGSSALSDSPWERIDLHAQTIEERNPQTSTHGFGLCQAVSLARNLGTLPPRLILYAIEGRQYALGDAMSPSAAKAFGDVVAAILDEQEIKECMNSA